MFTETEYNVQRAAKLADVTGRPYAYQVTPYGYQIALSVALPHSVAYAFANAIGNGSEGRISVEVYALNEHNHVSETLIASGSFWTFDDATLSLGITFPEGR